MNSQPQTPTRRPQVFRLTGLRPEYGYAPSTIWKYVSAGLWPPPIKLTGRACGWLAAECDAVLAARVRGETDATIRALVLQLKAARAHAGVEAA